MNRSSSLDQPEEAYMKAAADVAKQGCSGSTPGTAPSDREPWEHRSEALAHAIHHGQVSGGFEWGEDGLLKLAGRFEDFLSGRQAKEQAAAQAAGQARAVMLARQAGAEDAFYRLRKTAELASREGVQVELTPYGLRLTTRPTPNGSVSLSFGWQEINEPHATLDRLRRLAAQTGHAFGITGIRGISR